jgi:hypothetical protein
MDFTLGWRERGSGSHLCRTPPADCPEEVESSRAKPLHPRDGRVVSVATVVEIGGDSQGQRTILGAMAALHVVDAGTSLSQRARCRAEHLPQGGLSHSINLPTCASSVPQIC